LNPEGMDIEYQADKEQEDAIDYTEPKDFENPVQIIKE
jgi:hypothetical protein